MSDIFKIDKYVDLLFNVSELKINEYDNHPIIFKSIYSRVTQIIPIKYLVNVNQFRAISFQADK